MDTILIADLDQVIGRRVYGLENMLTGETVTGYLVSVEMVTRSPHIRRVTVEGHEPFEIVTGYVDVDGKRRPWSAEYGM